MKTIQMASALALLAITGTAFAANVHLKGRSGVTYTDEGTTLSASLCLTGLGEGDLLVVLDGDGIGETECYNPSGNHAPGQDTEISAVGEMEVPDSQIKNGNVCFSVETDEPNVDWQTAECPNPKWTADVIDVAWTAGTLHVYQGGEEVFTHSM